MSLLDRIIEKTKEKGISIRQLERACNMGNGVIDNWSSSWPRSDKLLAVANYLQISVEYLLTGKENEDLTEEEKELLRYFRQLPIREQMKEIGRLEEKAEQYSDQLETSSTSRTG